jgi:ubiquinone/menaquinone biosynthesis C-methylase UbiE
MAEDNIFSDSAFARRYAEKHQKMANNFGAEYTRKLAARGFSRGKILDAGCGFGGTLLVLAKNFPETQCVGIDMSDTLLDLARQKAAAEGLEERVRFEKGDVLNLPYPDDSFDVVISTNVLHHVGAPLVMLQELERVLAPQGMLYIADIRRSWLAALFDKAFREAMSYGEVLALLYEAKLPKEPFTSGFLWWRYER